MDREGDRNKQNCVSLTKMFFYRCKYLLLQAECCGIYSYAYGELSQYVSPNQIPIFCCKENPLTEPYSETNVTCTNLQQWDLNHGSVSIFFKA